MSSRLVALRVLTPHSLLFRRTAGGTLNKPAPVLYRFNYRYGLQSRHVATGGATESSEQSVQAEQAETIKVTTEGNKQLRSPQDVYESMVREMDQYLAQGLFDDAYEVLQSMRNIGLRPTKELYDRLIVQFGKNKHIYKVRDCIEWMGRDRTPADESTYMSLVHAYTSIAQYEWAQKAFMQMTLTIVPSVKSYQEIIELFARDTHVGNIRKAEEIFYSTLKFDMRPNSETCSVFIRHLLAGGYEGDVDRALEVLKYMKERHIYPIPEDVYRPFQEHLDTLIEPREFVRMKKVLRGLQHGGLRDDDFKKYWVHVQKKKWIRSIKRADLAPT